MLICLGVLVSTLGVYTFVLILFCKSNQRNHHLFGGVGVCISVVISRVFFVFSMQSLHGYKQTHFGENTRKALLIATCRQIDVRLSRKQKCVCLCVCMSVSVSVSVYVALLITTCVCVYI